MTSADVQLRIRPPLWARAWIVVFVPVWLSIFFTQLRSGPITVPAVLVGAAVIAFGIRMVVMGVVGTADGRLTVRNQLWTRTFRREELSDAVVDRAHGRFGTGWTVWLVLRDGSRHRVQLTESPFRAGFSERFERHAAELRAWMGGDTR